MARITTYEQDSNVSFEDKLLGTDSVTGGTKNFTIQSLMNLINELSGVSLFDGVLFKYQEYDPSATDPRGILNLVGGIAASTPFTSVTQIILSKKVVNGVDVENYLRSFAGKRIKISKQDDFDVFATFKVNSVADYTNTRYLTFAVEHVQSNGSFNPEGLFFASYHSDASVTDLEDVSSAGSGQIITSAERTAISNSVKYTDVKDNLVSTDTNKPLSANQGYVLKGLIDNINTLLTSDNIDLDTLQEVVDFIEANRTTLNSLTISNIAGLQNALDNKVDVVSGKELSTNDFTDALLTKLNGIAAGAEVNVQSDWAEVSATSDAFIQNKPTDVTDLSQHNATELADITSSGSGQIISSAERTKLAGIQAGAEANVQVDWNETNSGSDAFIVNKPSITPSSRTIEIAGTANEVDVTPSGPQDLSANRTFTVGLPNDVTISSDLIVNDTIELVNDQASTPTFQNGFYVKNDDGHDTIHFRYHGHDISIDKFTEVIPTGILNGGNLSVSSSTEFTIAAGNGIINDLNKTPLSEPHPEIINVSWSSQTLTVSGLNSGDSNQLNTWIYVDQNGTVQQQNTVFTEAQVRSNIIIGAAIHSSGILRFVRTFPRTAYNATSQILEFVSVFGPIKKSGHVLSANGTNLSLDRSAGVSFALGRNYDTDPENPSTVTDSSKTQCVIHRYYKDGIGGFVKDDGIGAAGYSVLDPTKYDNGSGTLVSVSSGHYSTQRFYYFPSTPDILIAYYGVDEYNSIESAELNLNLETVAEADNTAQQAIYLGAIIVKSSASDLSDSAQAKFFVSGNFRSLASTPVGQVLAAYLSDLTDVNVSNPTNNQILRYNSSSAYFENVNLDTDGVPEGSTNLYYTSARFDNDLSGKTTDNVSEGISNLYYTSTRFNNDLSGKTTDDVSEGSTNLYYTSTRFNNDFSNKDTDGLTEGATNLYYTSTRFNNDLSVKTTDDITEGSSNLYYTDSRSRSAITVTGAGSYNNITGVINVTGGVTSVNGQSGSVSLDTDDVSEGATNLYHTNARVDARIGLASIDDLSDVDTTTNAPVSGEVLKWNGTNFVPGVAGANLSTSSIGDLSDVDITSFAPSTGNVLKWNGTNFIPAIDNSSAASNSFKNLAVSGQNTVVADSSSDTLTLVAGGGMTITTDSTSDSITFEAAGGVGALTVDNFTGNGSTAIYQLTASPTSENFTDIYFDGVYQQKNTYTLNPSNSQITFDTNVANGVSIEVRSLEQLSVSDIVKTNLVSDSFTATANQTAFTLVNGNPAALELTMVFVQGVYQSKTNYSLNSGDIVFSTGLTAGDIVEVISIKGANTTTSPVLSVNGQTGVVSIPAGVASVNGQTGAVTISTTPTVSVISANTTAQANYVYVFTASLTLTLPASPSSGDSIKISNRSGTTTCVLGANGNNIMGSASDLTLDTASASFELIYSDTTNGWVIIGQ
jgi:hypothetical protein